MNVAPTVAHCVWLPALRGGQALLGVTRRCGFASHVGRCMVCTTC